MAQPRPPDSLRRHLLWRLGILVAAIVLLGAGVTFALARHYASDVFDQWLLDSASTLASQVKATTDPAHVDLPRSAVEMFEFDAVDRVYYDVTTAEGIRIFGNAPLSVPSAVPNDGRPLFYDAGIMGTSVRVVAMRMSGPQPVTVQVAETTNKRDALIAKILLSTVGPQVVLLVLAALAIWYAVSSGMRTLDKITGTLAGYRPGRPRSRSAELPAVAAAPLEVQPLVAAIHQLVEKLSDAEAIQQRFIANASHQMRTPLAALQVQAERALREPDPVKHLQALESVLKTLKRLRHLSNQLLVLARADPVGSPALKLRPVDLAVLAREQLGNWTDAAIEAGADLGYEGPQTGARVMGEPQLLAELLGNLVDNALRYGRRSDGAAPRITVAIASTAAGTTLEVQDDGPGIPEDERPRVVERFYRRPQSMGEGTGLGLAIASEIADRHGADLTIATGDGGAGTRIVVRFPPSATDKADEDPNYLRNTRYESTPSSTA